MILLKSKAAHLFTLDVVFEGGYLRSFTRGGQLFKNAPVVCEKELAHQNCRAYKGDPYGHSATTFE